MELTYHRRFPIDAKEVARFLGIALCLCLCVTLFLVANMDVAYCTDSTEANTSASSGIDAIEEVITLAANEIYNIIRAIVLPIVIVFLGYAGLQFLIGGTKGTDKARSICIGCFCAILLVVFAPVIANQVGEWFSAYGGDGLDNYNPLD